MNFKPGDRVKLLVQLPVFGWHKEIALPFGEQGNIGIRNDKWAAFIGLVDVCFDAGYTVWVSTDMLEKVAE